MGLSARAKGGASPLDKRRVLPIFALVFVDMLGLTVILPLLHLYAAAYGAGPLQIALVIAAFPLAQLVGLPVMGALSDRYGRKPLLLLKPGDHLFQLRHARAGGLAGAGHPFALDRRLVWRQLLDGAGGAERHHRREQSRARLGHHWRGFRAGLYLLVPSSP